MIPAKLHAPIKNTAPECIKLTSNIKDLMLDDLELGLQKLSQSIAIYKVDTIFSNECPSCCTNFKYICKCCPERVWQPPETAGTAKYCEMFDKFFDCLNVRNTKQKPFLIPYIPLCWRWTIWMAYEYIFALFHKLEKFNRIKTWWAHILTKTKPDCLYHGRLMTTYSSIGTFLFITPRKF